MFPVTKPQQCVRAASLTSNVDTETQDSVATMKVCRVCLSMNVKMYHMLEYKLSVMYERVTGVGINSEDKLPTMLCWECVAKLSSANNFIEKALKSLWILFKKNNGGKITMSDIESIDRAQHQLESTLGFKYYEVNNADLHIQKESHNTSDANNFELLNINGENSKLSGEFEPFTIKTEISHTTEQDDLEADLQFPKPIIIIKENLSDDEMTIDSVSNACDMFEEKYDIVDIEREVNEAIKQKQKGKQFSVAACSNWNEGLFFTKQPRVIVEDVMLSLKNKNTQDSFRGPLTKFKENVTHSPIMKGNLLEDGNNSVEILNTVNSNINFIHHDAESSKNLFVCDICDKSYQKKTALRRHIQGHLNLYKCTYCSYKTYVKSSLKSHVNSKHTKNSFYKCIYCVYKTFYKSKLKIHVISQHTNKTVYKCSYCSYKTYVKTCLSRHENSMHTKKTVYNCSYCSYKTYVKTCLSRHENTMHTKNTVYNCSYCSFKSYDKSYLNRHENSMHTKDTVYNCVYCSYKTYDKTCISRHENSMHTKNTVYNCSYCSYKAYSKSALNNHVNAKHTKNNVFNCSYCNHKAYGNIALNNHVNAKHTKNTVYNCTYCTFKTYIKSCLNIHVNRKHTKNTVYKCTHCTFKTYVKSSLTSHMKRKHIKNIVYNCTYCIYKTYIKGNLNRHVNSKHTKNTVVHM